MPWEEALVQDGTGGYVNPLTKRRVTADEIYRFASSNLQLNYIFWGTEEPFFHSQILPFLVKMRSARIGQSQRAHIGN